jgi:DNA-directed RNA polymerase beta' subunit
MADKFSIEVLEQDKFIKRNDSTKAITNPSMFAATGGPTPDGLLSNEIFGITKDERSGIYGYIDLKDYYLNPYCYKIWSKIDKNLRACVYETDTFIIDKNGFLIQDDNGDTGLKFLYKNRKNIKFKQTKKDEFLKALDQAKNNDTLFLNKLIITPPFYRDVDTTTNGRVGVGEINKLYIALINSINATSDIEDYGLDMSGAIRGRIQETITEIYNWYTLGESIIGGEHTGAGIFKKFGAMRRTVMGKTTDYAVRLVISAADIEQDSVKDLMVDLDYSAIPLASMLIIAYPFIIYELRSLFNNEFGGKQYYSDIDSKGNIQQVTLDNPQIAFSDDVLDKEINEFIHGYSNRFKPIKVPNKEGKDINLRLKGYSITADEYAAGKRDGILVERDLTWMDLFYIAACKASEDKMAIIVRYPINKSVA